MSRRKREITGLSNERDFPFAVSAASLPAAAGADMRGRAVIENCSGV
jgi:hypothetical protein